MTKPPNEATLFHGQVIDRKELDKYTFPVGSKFHFRNASYNDSFTVISIRKDPGAEYRQILGSVAGEVWILLSSLQKEAAVGAVTFPATTAAAVVPKPAKKTTKKASKKKTK